VRSVVGRFHKGSHEGTKAQRGIKSSSGQREHSEKPLHTVFSGNFCQIPGIDDSLRLIG
jgi:hypothetical protein